jgi:predicted CXXCH cytochrome family protein
MFGTGTDLKEHHPVSFTYDDSYQGELGIGELNTPDNVFTAAYTFGGDAASALVECASCHDPHNGNAPAEESPFLRDSNAGSAICFTCHLK